MQQTCGKHGMRSAKLPWCANHALCAAPSHTLLRVVPEIMGEASHDMVRAVPELAECV
jgi:hypothetical protein